MYQKKIDPISEKIFVATMTMFIFQNSSSISFLNPRTPYNVEQEIVDFHGRYEGIGHFMVSSTLYGGPGVCRF